LNKICTQLLFLFCSFSLCIFNTSLIYAEKEPLLKEIIGQLNDTPPEIQDMILSPLMKPVQDYLRGCMLNQSKKRTFKRLLGHSTGVHSVCFSPNGTKLASGSGDCTINIWDVTGRKLQSLSGHTCRVWPISFSPVGTLASGSGDGTIKIWDLKSENELQTLYGHNDSEVFSVSFSSDGTKLASGSDDKTIKIWDVVSMRKLKTLKGHKDRIGSVFFSPDRTKLASGSDDKTIKIWNVSSGEELQTLRGHNKGVRSVCFSPDGTKLASGSCDKTIKIWDIPSGKELRTLEHNCWVLSVCFSPDGTQLASGLLDGSIIIWDVASWKKLQTLSEHYTWVDSVCFNPDGTKLASGSDDNTIRIWNLYDKRDQEILEIINSEYKLTSAQKLLLYILYWNHQDLKHKEGINLTQTEQELKTEYGQNPPKLLNLKQIYDSLPPELKNLVKFSFNVNL
jgi:WD40 repeat protein